MTRSHFFIAGGAGFIGSHFCDHLLASGDTTAVTLYDNFSSGRDWHFGHHLGDGRLHVVRGDVEDTEALVRAMEGHDVVIHLASNPDIARAAREPTIDFTQGTVLTSSVVEAMRRTSAKRLLYASGSGVYGDLGTREVREDHGPLVPISTYGASKLAGEALIAAYVAMFDLRACVFRFANVVGPRQTHGVGLDFARRLWEGMAAGHRPVSLRILGDGSQSKSYIHVDDVVRAVLMAHARAEAPFCTYNVGTGDAITVREIAELAVECVGLARDGVAFTYAGGDRGWKGDVPVVRLDTERIQALGWRCRLNSREALRQSMLAMIPALKAGKM